MKILVCDDQEEHCDYLVNTLQTTQTDATVESLPPKELGTVLTELFGRIRRLLNCLASQSTIEEEKTFFDGFDIIVIDNNLTHLNVSGGRLTAESIAGYLRAFTTGTYIISVNKNPEVDFDLRFLVGDYRTRADMALKDIHLGNRALWTGNPREAEEEFIPWYWPSLQNIVDRRQDQINFVRDRLEKQVFSSLDFTNDAIFFLSDHALGALFPDSNEYITDNLSIHDVTFRDVFLKVDSLPIPDDRKLLHEAKENSTATEIVARVVAAYIDLWFRRDVLGPQAALVDIPHLLMRLPFLLGERVVDSDEWNRAIVTENPPYNLDMTLYKTYLEEAEFKHRMWTAGPCFWWPELKYNDTLNEYFMNMVETDWANVVFCEDTSSFVDRSSTDWGDVTEFSAEFEGNWKRRYVQRIPGKQYSPRTRFAV